MPTPSPLEILQKGFDVLKRKHDKKRKELTAKAKKEKLTEEEESWLDFEGNVVDEQRMLLTMTEAESYEKGLEGLSAEDKMGLDTRGCSFNAEHNHYILLHLEYQCFRYFIVVIIP
ncbi:hypothetical protein FA13DRAFT_1815173 [Coprinellus micaceus]|uniref:Uncharacterized protein n=1 Tax=Coprinellus micaceus TaxID=71717 RepID=A0A4Y7T5S7_COPMI|nr:hypothetical protein FA13DRAFT_1815173 [Coprinellus micaceus]